MYNRRSRLGLPGSTINVETGKWSNTESHLSGGIDSYYEYLLKAWILFGDQDCERATPMQAPPMQAPPKERSQMFPSVRFP